MQYSNIAQHVTSEPSETLRESAPAHVTQMIDLAIGLATAIGSAAAFGSFGVPIKCRRILDAKVGFCIAS